VIGPAADCRRGLRGTAVIDPTDPACPEAPGAAGAAVLKSHPAPEWPSEAPFVLRASAGRDWLRRKPAAG